MSHLLTSRVEEQLRRLGRSWPNRGWTWDERSGCVASSFAGSNQGSYESVLSQVFEAHWDHRTISKAPAVVARVAERTGGIRSGQRIFAPAECGNVFPFALWWPWGDDTTVSVRVSLAPDTPSSRAIVREAFGVVDT